LTDINAKGILKEGKVIKKSGAKKKKKGSAPRKYSR